MKENQRSKKRRNPKKKSPASKKKGGVYSDVKSPQERPVKQKSVRNIPKKATERKGEEDRSILKYISKARQFLRESRMELKKVKWPSRKELLASTAVVIVLTLLMACFFCLVDFGLIKIIKSIAG